MSLRLLDGPHLNHHLGIIFHYSPLQKVSSLSLPCSTTFTTVAPSYPPGQKLVFYQKMFHCILSQRNDLSTSLDLLKLNPWPTQCLLTWNCLVTWRFIHFSMPLSKNHSVMSRPPTSPVQWQPASLPCNTNPRHYGRGFQYVVDWEGYGPKEHSWVSQIVREFHRRHPNKVGVSPWGPVESGLFLYYYCVWIIGLSSLCPQ